MNPQDSSEETPPRNNDTNQSPFPFFLSFFLFLWFISGGWRCGWRWGWQQGVAAGYTGIPAGSNPSPTSRENRHGRSQRSAARCNATGAMNRRLELTSAGPWSSLTGAMMPTPVTAPALPPLALPPLALPPPAPLFDLADEDMDDVDDAPSTHPLERQTTVEHTDSENATVTSHLSLPHLTLNRHQVRIRPLGHLKTVEHLNLNSNNAGGLNE